MELYLLKYNNYYNRIVKREASLNAYLTYQVSTTITNVSFNPNDGINTTQVINKLQNEVGDYLICANGNTIISRWFIIEAKRERTGQYTLQLRRDVVADNYNSIINAPCFIEKATLNDSDPMILNNENMTFNQIKTSELMLKDNTNSAWIVGYYARTASDNTTTQLSGTGSYQGVPDITINGDISTFDYTNNQVINGGVTTMWLGVSVVLSQYSPTVYRTYYINEDVHESNASYTNNNSTLILNPDNGTIEFWENFLASLNSNNYTWTELLQDFNTLIGASNLNDALYYNNKIIKTINNGINKYYRVTLEPNGDYNSADVYVTTGSLFNKLSNIVADMPGISNVANNNTFQCLGNSISSYIVKITEIANIQKSSNYNITTNRYFTNDSPYDVFCIPYSDDIVIKSTGDVSVPDAGVNISKNVSMSVAMDIANQYSGVGTLYDLQLLPYCPMESVIVQDDGTIDLQNDSKLYSKITNNNVVIGFIINCNVSSWTFNIPLTNPITITNKKLQNECDMYRLVSPNFNGQFEFNPAKNNGVNRFNVDCTYKPYNPYIHINPDFKALYGNDYNDARGLICQGDFSLPVVTDQFKTYELQNKNYQNIFDRGTKNLEINNRLNNIQQVVGAGTSAIATGVGAGLLAGPGAGIGAGIASAVGGVADYAITKAQQNEALDYRQDQFNMNLGNIKAMPDSISKTSAFTYNNKIYPILEYYTCTDKEKQALINKLYYNGMTVGRIGTISEFIKATPTYIKGKIIRIENIDDEYHFINEIANEINKGVFI